MGEVGQELGVGIAMARRRQHVREVPEKVIVPTNPLVRSLLSDNRDIPCDKKQELPTARRPPGGCFIGVPRLDGFYRRDRRGFLQSDTDAVMNVVQPGG